MSGAILGEAAELSCQSAAPLLHGFNQYAYRCRFGPCTLYAADQLSTAYARYSEAHALPYSVILSYYPFDFVFIALFVFAAE